MENKIKYQLIIITPLGTHKTTPTNLGEDEYDELVVFVKQITDGELDSVALVDDNSDDVFLAKEILLKSVIKIIKC